VADPIAGPSPLAIYRPGRIFKRTWPDDEPYLLATYSITLDETSQTSTSGTAGALAGEEFTNPAPVLISRRGRITAPFQAELVRREFAEDDTSQTQSSDTADITEHATVAAQETAQTQASDDVTANQNLGIPLTETAQTQASEEATLTEAAQITLTDSSQAQTSDTVDPITGVDGDVDATADAATASAAGARVVTGDIAVQAEPVTVVAFDKSVVTILGAQQFTHYRGSRVIAIPRDGWFYPKDVTGSAAVQAGSATVSASGSSLTITGDAAVQAQSASARLRGPGVKADVTLTSPEIPFVQRRNRRTIVVDYIVYRTQSTTQKTGIAAASADPATVSTTGIRTITGDVTADSLPATASGSATKIVGAAGAFADPATVAAIGEHIFVLTGSAVADSATVSIAGDRVITASGAVAAQSSLAAGQGALLGAVSGTGFPTASAATASITGARGYTGTGSPQALSSTVSATGVRGTLEAPLFSHVSTLLSRTYRATSIDFSRYLVEGEGTLVFEIGQGTLPPGLLLDTGTGIVSGIPNVEGFYDLTIRCTNINGTDETNLFRWIVTGSIPRAGVSANQNVVTIVGL
jgi:hypothetical protein